MVIKRRRGTAITFSKQERVKQRYTYSNPILPSRWSTLAGRIISTIRAAVNSRRAEEVALLLRGEARSRVSIG